MNINERIFDLLLKQSKTSKDLGEYIGVKPSSISAWKNSGSYPSSKHLIRICEYFNVSPNYLLIGEDKKSSQSDLTESEREILKLVQPLSDKDKIKVIGIIENYLGNRASDIPNIQPMYIKEEQADKLFKNLAKKPL